MGRVELRKVSGGLAVPGCGTVTRGGALRPSKELRTADGRSFRVEARTRVTTVVGSSGEQVGVFRRAFWTRHGTLAWDGREYDVRAGVWSSTYELRSGESVVATVRLRTLGESELTAADDIDPVLALTAVALAMITRSYAGAAAAG